MKYLLFFLNDIFNEVQINFFVKYVKTQLSELFLLVMQDKNDFINKYKNFSRTNINTSKV